LTPDGERIFDRELETQIAEAERNVARGEYPNFCAALAPIAKNIIAEKICGHALLDCGLITERLSAAEVKSLAEKARQYVDAGKYPDFYAALIQATLELEVKRQIDVTTRREEQTLQSFARYYHWTAEQQTDVRKQFAATAELPKSLAPLPIYRF
jgi:hypothetical protein